ncbi:FACT complex subunit POB3, partial [Bienertia sinuspersici]
MDLRATKEKLALPIKSAEYRVGVDDFMVYATRSLTSSDDKLRCPCIKCVNNKLLSPDDVNYHLLHFGIMRNYNNWTFHGEVVDEISFEPMVEYETRGETNLRQTMANRKNKKLRMANANSNRGEINVGNLEQSNTHHTRVEDQQHQSSNSRNQGSDEGSRHEAQEDEGAFMNTLCKARFLYPNALEKWILKSIGLKWKDYKCYLKGKYYNDDIDINIVQDRCPSDVEKDQWISLVNLWRSEEGKRGKESLMNAKVKPISTTGTKSHARVHEELKKELKKSPTRTQTYLACHTHDNEAEITNQIKSIVAEQGDKEMNLDDDPISKVLGKDQYDRVRGLGLGAKPSNFAEISAPPYCTGLNLSSKDERAIFYHLRQLKGWTQRLNKRVKRQDTTIKKLKSKLQSQFGSDFDDSDFNNSDSGSSDFDEDDDFNIHGVDK